MDILERFKKYIAFDTMSDENSTSYPSAKSELEFGKILEADLKEIGVENAYQDERGLVYGRIENGSEKTIGLIAHMDTAPTIQGGCTNTKFVQNYDGNDIPLNEKYTMKVEDFPFLRDLRGQDLLCTDGEHLLGGDDKAGICIIFAFAEYYLAHKDEFAYNLAICFTPDEEIGMGPAHFDVNKMKADIAYTVDGGPIDRANFENFNAAAAKLEIDGVGVHPGSAKNIMVNAVLLAIEFNNMLPQDAIPSKTENYEGFIHLEHFTGDVEHVELGYILRDHDATLLENQKKTLQKAADFIQKKYPTAKVNLKIRDQYKNMHEYFLKDMTAIEVLNKAYINSHTPLQYEPIRGGTDGATITYMGLPCPNIGTGGYNMHGRYEFISVTQMKKMVEIIKELFK